MRPRLRAATLTTLALSLPVLSLPMVAGPASGAAPTAAVRSVSEYTAVPTNGELTVRGRGYGHGRGMSQHGAHGAAQQGLSHEQILGFYYPGTRLERSNLLLKVLITADTSDDLVVLHRSGLKVADLGANKVHTLPQNLKATRWRIVANWQNRNVVQYLVGSTWKTYKVAGAATLRGTGEFRASTLDLVTPRGTTTYRGWLRAAKPNASSKARDTVNVLWLDPYVKGVVAAEMPASWHPEAVQAQTVAARTYAVYHRERAGSRYYHICDTTACQVYGGVAKEHALSNAAVTATSRQVLTYSGKAAFTEFSSSSGGWTVASTVPYQVAKADPYDGAAKNSHHTWTTKLSRTTIEKAYPTLGRLKGIKVTQRDGNGLWGGRVLKVVLDGTTKDVTQTGDQLRLKLRLKSTWLDF